MVLPMRTTRAFAVIGPGLPACRKLTLTSSVGTAARPSLAPIAA